MSLFLGLRALVIEINGQDIRVLHDWFRLYDGYSSASQDTILLLKVQLAFWGLYSSCLPHERHGKPHNTPQMDQQASTIADIISQHDLASSNPHDLSPAQLSWDAEKGQKNPWLRSYELEHGWRIYIYIHPDRPFGIRKGADPSLNHQ